MCKISLWVLWVRIRMGQKYRRHDVLLWYTTSGHIKITASSYCIWPASCSSLEDFKMKSWNENWELRGFVKTSHSIFIYLHAEFGKVEAKPVIQNRVSWYHIVKKCPLVPQAMPPPTCSNILNSHILTYSVDSCWFWSEGCPASHVMLELVRDDCLKRLPYLFAVTLSTAVQ